MFTQEQTISYWLSPPYCPIRIQYSVHTVADYFLLAEATTLSNQITVYSVCIVLTQEQSISYWLRQQHCPIRLQYSAHTGAEYFLLAESTTLSDQITVYCSVHTGADYFLLAEATTLSNQNAV